MYLLKSFKALYTLMYYKYGNHLTTVFSSTFRRPQTSFETDARALSKWRLSIFKRILYLYIYRDLSAVLICTFRGYGCRVPCIVFSSTFQRSQVPFEIWDRKSTLLLAPEHFQPNNNTCISTVFLSTFRGLCMSWPSCRIPLYPTVK